MRDLPINPILGLAGWRFILLNAPPRKTRRHTLPRKKTGIFWPFITMPSITLAILYMEYHPPAMAHVSAEDAAIYGNVITSMYRFHDILLGRLLDLVGPDTTVILLSDHGFYHNHLRPKVREHFREPSKKFGAEMNPITWHRLQGVFAATGQGIKRDELFYGTSLLDIAPTILALLGLPIPDDMDGRVLTRIFAEPVELERIASYEPPHENDGIHRNVSEEET